MNIPILIDQVFLKELKVEQLQAISKNLADKAGSYFLLEPSTKERAYQPSSTPVETAKGNFVTKIDSFKQKEYNYIYHRTGKRF